MTFTVLAGKNIDCDGNYDFQYVADFETLEEAIREDQVNKSYPFHWIEFRDSKGNVYQVQCQQQEK